MAQNPMTQAQFAGQLGCIAHPHLGAVAGCSTCSRGLCPDCATRFEPPSCDACVVAHNLRAEGRHWAELAVTACIAIGGSILLCSTGTPFGKGIIMGLQYAFAWWGWRFLSTYLPWVSGTGLPIWLFLCLLKMLASLAIGWVVGPYQIYRSVTLLRALRHARALVSSYPASLGGGGPRPAV